MSKLERSAFPVSLLHRVYPPSAMYKLIDTDDKLLRINGSENAKTQICVHPAVKFHHSHPRLLTRDNEMQTFMVIMYQIRTGSRTIGL